ncbi:MAG: acetoacetate decarboxylase family protein [Blastocatellia bacterium]
MKNDQDGINRREFLELTAAGVAMVSTAGSALSAQLREDDPTPQLSIRWRTDPERIRRILPPPLEMDDDPHVAISLVGTTAPPQLSRWFPGAYVECFFQVSAKYKGKRGMFEFIVPHTWDCDQSRNIAREQGVYSKKDTSVWAERDGDVIRAYARRRGKMLFRLETVLTDKAAHPKYVVGEVGYGAFSFKFRHNPDWRQGELISGPVELWRRGGFEEGWPAEMAENANRACDLAKTKFEFPDPGVLDPISEFPVRELLAVSVGFGRNARPVAAGRTPLPGPPSAAKFLAEVDKKAFEPWAFFSYDRPISAGQAWVPAGWPEKATALKLTADELKRYRQRDALEIAPAEIFYSYVELDAATHAKTLPPGLKPGDRPLLRVLAVKAALSDLSTLPYNEVWLMSRCEIEGKPAWYALANIVGQDGERVFGREHLGYPSKSGEVTLSVDEQRSKLECRRLHREVVRFEAPLGKSLKTPYAATQQIIGLRLVPGNPSRQPRADSRQPRAELIAQPWDVRFDWLRQADPQKVKLEFPAEAGPGVIGKPDPWFEFSAGKVVQVFAGAGVIRRLPGRIIGEVADLAKHYIERFDQGKPGGTPAERNSQSSFLIG